MSCPNTVSFKRGTSFAASCTYTPSAGAPANLTGTTVTSSIVDSQYNQYDLTVTIAAGGLTFTAVYPGDSSSWALGLAKWDLRFQYGGTVFYSTTMRIDVIGEVTPS